jgi:methionyl-tRNA formyltransferase
VPIRPEDDAQILHDRLAALGAALLVNTIKQYVSGAIAPANQPAEGVSYARKLTKEDGRLDWRRPAPDLWNRLRALNPWPGVFTFLAGAPKPVLLKVWKAEVLEGATGLPGTVLQADRQGLVVACAAGALCITELQREGGRRLGVAAFLAGHPLVAGQVLE